MKKQFFRVIAAMTLLLSAVAMAGAQTALPNTGWWTSTTIQNVGASAATIELAVYPQSSSTTVSSAQVAGLASGSSALFVPGGANANGTVDVSPSLGTNFAGSLVVSADQPIVAVGNIGNNPIFSGSGVTGGTAGGYFRGSDSRSNSLVYPAVKNNYGGKTTVFFVQAAGADVALSATIKTNAGTTHTYTGNLSANKSVMLHPSAFTPAVASTTCGALATTACFGTITVTATGGNIVGTVVEYKEGESPNKITQSASMFATSEASNTLYCPTIKNEYNATQKRSTGMTVANTSASAITVDVEFKVSAGANAGTTYNQNAVSIPAGGSVNFSKFDNNLGGMPVNNFGSAKITVVGGANAVVAAVTESNFAPSTPIKATTYTCFGVSSATAKVALPSVKHNYPTQASGALTGVTVQNVTTASTFTVSAVYACKDNLGNVLTPVTKTSPSLAPGASYNFFNEPTEHGTNGSFCSVTLDAGTGNKIVALAQETFDFATNATPKLNDTKNYEGFNQ